MPRFLAARHALAAVGLLAALAGVGLDDRRVTWVAIVLLAVAALLRLIATRRSRAEPASDEDPPAD